MIIRIVSLLAIASVEEVFAYRAQHLLMILLVVREVDRWAHYMRVEHEFSHTFRCDIAVEAYAVACQSDILVGVVDEFHRHLLAWRYRRYVLRSRLDCWASRLYIGYHQHLVARVAQHEHHREFVTEHYRGIVAHGVLHFYDGQCEPLVARRERTAAH